LTDPDRPAGPLDPVFFLSDYGLADEFVGVVHAVIAHRCPAATVVDLTHGVPPFDIRAGADALARAGPHLGPGVVLAVVDPGVGTPRRGVALEVATGTGPRWWVGPDNGLLIAAAEGAGPIVAAYRLRPADDSGPGSDARPGTFDGRDLFAPAAAALLAGDLPAGLGDPVDRAGLVRLPAPLVDRGMGPDGRPFLRTEVTWVDRFGNVQLAGVPGEGPSWIETGPVALHTSTEAPWPLRRVGAFADLGPGELGLLVDANGRWALVRAEGSAAGLLDLAAGAVVEFGPVVEGAGPG
jgi:S-adenosylmethionine hydrolase